MADALLNTTLICEGAEKAVAVHLAFPEAQVVGLPGIARLAKIPPIKGTALIIRDGDPAGSSAAKSLIRGTDQLHLTGTTMVRVTETPLGMDADAIVLADGVAALRQLTLAAPEVQLSAAGEARRLAGIRDVLEYEEERSGR